MKFVKGSPIKGGKETCWYLCICDDQSRKLISRLLSQNAKKFLSDPHRNFSSFIAAKASNELAIEVVLGKHNGYYVNKNGGMTNKLFAISETQDLDCFPGESRIKVSKWPNGNHFYAHVDNIDVVDERGNIKWNTAKLAEKAAKKFMSKLSRKSKDNE